MTIGTLPTAPKFTLERHEIAQVICQVRFSPVFRLQQSEELARLQDEVRDEYPDFAQEQAVSFLITPQGVAQQDTGARNYRFIDHKTGIMLVVGVDFVAIETRRYAAIDQIVDRVCSAVALIERLYAPASRLRLGLRFTNEFRLDASSPAASAKRAFNASLLGVVADDSLATGVSQSQSVVRFAASDGVALQMIHGLQPQGTTVAPAPGFPAPIQTERPFYLLDIDAFSEGPVPLSSAAVAEEIDAYNDHVRTLFYWATTDEFRTNVLGQQS